MGEQLAFMGPRLHLPQAIGSLSQVRAFDGEKTPGTIRLAPLKIHSDDDDSQMTPLTVKGRSCSIDEAEGAQMKIEQADEQ